MPAAPWLHISWTSADRRLAGDGRPRIMAILNVTPDSFSDGDQWGNVGGAAARAVELAADGADLIDIGGESSRPGAVAVSESEELRRVLPVVEALAGGAMMPPLSVDTTKAAVARAALAAGAAIVNDITALGGDPAMARVVADAGAAVVLMHMRGTPITMQDRPDYSDVVAEVYEFLARRVEWAGSQGIERERIAVDPGIGFGKTVEHNLLLLRHLERFASLGCTVLVGTSRKAFLGHLTGRPVEARQAASTASALAALGTGATIARVHEVAPLADALAVWQAQRGWP